MPLATKLCVPSISMSYTSSSATASMERILLHWSFTEAGAILAAMAEKTFSTSTIVSLSDVMLSSRPKVVVEDALVKLLKKRLKELNVLWVPSNFRKALTNPKLPADLLAKLENLIFAAELSDWKISNSLKFELDETIEDIESFNPAYREAMKGESREARRELKSGKLIPLEELRAELNAKR